MTSEDKKYLIGFSSNYCIGPKSLKVILDHGPRKVWQNGLSRSCGLSEKLILSINETRSKFDLDKYLKKIERNQFKILILGEKHYPKLLAEISDPPMILYYMGEILDSNLISIVGSRKCSHYAKEVIEKIVPDLALSNLSVVSGMAMGVDTISHKVALDNNTKTMAILGSGLDVIYPPSNKQLFDEINKSGAVISEFPLGTPPLRQNFPQRNRIIAGMSESTLIVEADINSGSLITARYALDFNRQVYAIPGDITRINARGTNNLIKLGAKPVTESSDILIDYGISLVSKKDYLPKNELERIIYEALGDEPKYIDKICEITDLDAIIVSQSLTMLELQSAIINIGNSTYMKK